MLIENMEFNRILTKKHLRMELSAELINEIAQELEAGMKVYLNKETLELILFLTGMK